MTRPEHNAESPSAPRRAVVVGGAGAIGRACAARLRTEGHEVMTADIAESADVVLDLRDAAAVADALSAAGRIDILLNVAGLTTRPKPMWEMTDTEWRDVFDVNVFGVAATCRAVVPGMVDRGWGRIVNVSSMAGKDGNANLCAYSASKAAVIGLIKALGKELATTGVLVNAIAPALIATEMNADLAPEVLGRLLRSIPMGRPGEPAEVAELVTWLASERCSFSTGAVYDVSGGRATY